MSHASTSLLLFVAADSLFVILPNRRSITACAGGLLLVLTGIPEWIEAFFEKVGWDVMGVFFGKHLIKVKAPTGGKKVDRFSRTTRTFRSGPNETFRTERV